MKFYASIPDAGSRSPSRAFLFFVLLLFTASPLSADRVRLVAGGGNNTNASPPLPALQAKLRSPFGAEFNSLGVLVLVEMTGHCVRQLTPDGQLTTIAGTGAKAYSGDGGPATQAAFNGMHNLAIAPNNDIYLADTWNNCVRKIDARTGLVRTVAGTGQKGFSGDGGPAHLAQFGGVYCASLDPASENLYLADLDNRRIRVVHLPTGIVRTVAGNGQKGVPADDAIAVNAPLVDPRAVIADRAGNVYVLERSGHALRVVSASGRIRTVVGTGAKGHSGDNRDAREATLNGPKHLCLDRSGAVVIADTENHVIRRYSPATGKIERIAGSGTAGARGIGGPALQLELRQPHGVHVHTNGVLYISDSGNHRVVAVEN
jgi:hypothetical protein